jgi:predicted transposase YdaD
MARQVPQAFVRLLGIEPDREVRSCDVSVNVPEHRADQVLLIAGEGDADRWALHIEFQLQPDERVLPGWFLKNAALTVQLGLPVILAAVYLTQGRRRRFPSMYRASAGPLANEFRFHAVRLWEHGDRIRSGELAELAPLLVLCEDRPTEETLREERALIRAVQATPSVRADLLSVALTVGARFFARELLLQVFREELPMFKEAWFVQDWIKEGELSGRAAAARESLLRLLQARFGELPPSVVAQVEQADPEWCQDVMVRLLTTDSLEELGLNGHPNGAGATP